MKSNFYNIPFTVYDRKKCLPTIKKIYELAIKARKQGILALENEVERLEEHFFKKALLFVIHGYTEEQMREILDNYIVFGNHNRDEVLQNIVIKEGLLAIYKGYDEEFVLELLFSCLGSEFEKEVEEYLSEYKDSRFPLKAPSRIEVIGKVRSLESMPVLVEKDVFDNVISTMSEDDLRKLAKKIYNSDIFLHALAGSAYDTKFRLITSLSNVQAYVTVKKIKQLPKISAEDVTKARNEIIKTLDELLKGGC